MTLTHQQIKSFLTGVKMMNKTTWKIRFCMSLLLATLMMGCAATATQESTGEYVDDSAITTKVKTSIYNDPELKIGQIGVETYDGVVQLSGFVNSKKAVAKATEIAKSVKGVHSVKNSLLVK
jgi:osmotically-inducible protein OsmY